MFVRKDSKSWVYVKLYVDDMLIGAKTIDSIKKVANELSSHFSLKFWETCDLALLLKWNTNKNCDK